MSKPVTLKTIADQLGLHVSTVSRVLNGGASKARSAASQELAVKIQTLADSLNYSPDAQAVTLRTQTRREIAVIVPLVSDVVMATTFEGVFDAALEIGFQAYVYASADSPAVQEDIIRSCLRRRVAGIVVGDIHIQGRQPGIDLLLQSGIPYVLVNRRRGDLTSIATDDHLGGKLVAQHFLEMGHRKIAVLAARRYASSGYFRMQGFLKAMAKHGVEMPAKAIYHGGFDAESGYEEGQRLLADHSDVSAVFAVNDMLAIGFMGACNEAGRKLGEDLSLVGYNDIAISRRLPIPLSSVEVPVYEIGRRALSMLTDRIAGASILSQILEPKLQVRASSQFCIPCPRNSSIARRSVR